MREVKDNLAQINLEINEHREKVTFQHSLT